MRNCLFLFQQTIFGIDMQLRRLCGACNIETIADLPTLTFHLNLNYLNQKESVRYEDMCVLIVCMCVRSVSACARIMCVLVCVVSCVKGFGSCVSMRVCMWWVMCA